MKNPKVWVQEESFEEMERFFVQARRTYRCPEGSRDFTCRKMTRGGQETLCFFSEDLLVTERTRVSLFQSDNLWAGLKNSLTNKRCTYWWLHSMRFRSVTPIDVIVCHAQQIPPNLKGTTAETWPLFLPSCRNSLHKKEKKIWQSRDCPCRASQGGDGPRRVSCVARTAGGAGWLRWAPRHPPLILWRLCQWEIVTVCE